MASLPKCIYKSVILSAGETFVLPPGAEIISVSDSSLLTNSCPTPFPTEDQKCYRITWVLNIDPEGTKLIHAIVSQVGSPFPPGPGFATVGVPNTGNAWETGDGDTAAITIDKVSIAGTTINAAVDAFDFTSLEGIIAGSPLAGILVDRKYNFWDQIQPLTTAEEGQWGDWWKSGYRVYTFHFKTIPSLASTIYFEFLSALNGDGGNIGSIPRFFAQEIDCAEYPTTTVVTTC